MSEFPFVGVDYGSKLAGTTVMACWDGQRLRFFSSEKKKDADAFLLDILPSIGAKHVYLDAPLSLPGVYRNMKGYDNYFYRKADSELGAMSPMFLGGLTARAMRLREQLSAKGIRLIETYPAYQAKRLNLKEQGYKKRKEDITTVLEVLSSEFSFPLPSALADWHHVDALLAMLTAVREADGVREIFGDQEEGVVVV
jgi:predicted nuclease with RNAse H fold